MLNNEPQWVAVYTKPRAEYQVAARLEGIHIESYVPTVDKIRKWSDRVKIVALPLFPSYVFARITLKQVVPVRGVQGAAMLISFGGKVSVVPDNDIRVIRTAIQADNDYVVENEHKQRKGCKVRVKAGTFQGCTGMLLDDGDGCNFAVEITALNVLFRTSIEKALLEVLPEEDKKPAEKKYNF